MTKHSTTTGPPSTSTRRNCFLACFGGSGKKTRLTDEVNSGSRRRCGNSKWSLFKKSQTKTVPVDLTTVPCELKPINAPATTTSNTSLEIQVVEENATSTIKQAMTVDQNHAPVTSGEPKTSRKKWSTAVNRPAATSATGSSLVSPERKTVTIAHPSVSPPLKRTFSKSVPPPKQQKRQHASAAAAGSKVDSGVMHRTRLTTLSGGEFDSIIGMSIVLVILAIMVLWGKLCAILCTSAWFFIARRLVAVRERSAADKPPPESHKNLVFESEEYKKKVVLEGLLQRNHRKVVGRL